MDWFAGPELCDQLTPVGEAFFPTLTLQVLLRGLAGEALVFTKLFAVRIEASSDNGRGKKGGGGLFGRRRKATAADGGNQFDDVEVRQAALPRGRA